MMKIRTSVIAMICAIVANVTRTDAATTGTKNLCPNGRFEHLQEAAASRLPQGWSPVRSGKSPGIEIVEGTEKGRRALRISAQGTDIVGMNSDAMIAERGVVRFRYKAQSSSAEGVNLGIYVLGFANAQGKEVTRRGFSPPKSHVGDGQWHEAMIEFDFARERATHFILAPRINESSPKTGDGEWLLENIEAYSVTLGPKVNIAYQWCEKPLARTGDKIRFSAFIENVGDEKTTDVVVELQITPNPMLADQPRSVTGLEPGSFRRLDWEFSSSDPGSIQAQARILPMSAAADAPPYKILVVDKDTSYTRQELCTDENGYWRLLEKPSTLQDNSSAPLVTIRHKKSSEIKHNTYGICAHLPRSKDYEDPFNPSHLIDDSPETCWSSQQRPSTYPGNAPWIEIDLGRIVRVAQLNLIPYWKNTDFPVGFSLLVSTDGLGWQTAMRVPDHRFNSSGEKRGDKAVQSLKLPQPTDARKIRVQFERLPLSGGNYAEVSQGYKARLSGVEVIDSAGRNAALTQDGATASASDTFTCWQNTARTVNESFERIFDIGFKWVRVSQWGDQTEWAAVEREKGKFHIDSVTDQGIQKLSDNGVDILFGLQYGNALYERSKTPGEIGPIYKEGHPFYLHAGPRTEEGRQAFARYAEFVVRKYRDRIHWWEVWNEENGWYPGHEPELYGKLLNVVARRIKEIDPTMKVMFGGTAAPTPVTTEIALREGAAPYIDATAFHPYGIDMPEGALGTMESHNGKNVGKSREEMGWNKLEDVIEGVKQPFVQHGNPNVQVWLNEWGTNVTSLKHTYNPHIGEYGCAKYMMRFYLYSGWLKMPAAWWALYNENFSQDWGIIDQDDYGLRPLSYALQNVCSVVSDAEPIASLDCKYDGGAPNPKLIAWRRDNSSETLVLVWAAEMNTDSVRSYPSVVSFAPGARPTRITLVDLYWGLSQPATWSYDGDRVVIRGLIAHDYPVVISCE